MKLVNRYTGKEPTPQEMEAIKRRAEQIFRNPYASWEQLEWAVGVHPEGIAACVPYDRALNNPHRAV